MVMQMIQEKKFVLVKELLSNAEKLEDYLHIQTVKTQDKLPRHSFDDVLTALNVTL